MGNEQFTIAFDLDGTLCTSIRNYHPEDILKVKPIEKWVGVLKELKKQGYKILIFTRRGVLPNSKELTEQWLKKYEIPYDELDISKPHYDLLIDDRAFDIYKGHITVDIIRVALEQRLEHIKNVTIYSKKES